MNYNLGITIADGWETFSGTISAQVERLGYRVNNVVIHICIIHVSRPQHLAHQWTYKGLHAQREKMLLRALKYPPAHVPPSGLCFVGTPGGLLVLLMPCPLNAFDGLMFPLGH